MLNGLAFALAAGIAIVAYAVGRYSGLREGRDRAAHRIRRLRNLGRAPW